MTACRLSRGGALGRASRSTLPASQLRSRASLRTSHGRQREPISQGEAQWTSGRLVLWAAFLIAAIFYTRHARNPRMRPLAAYLIFAVIFTMSSFALFVVLTAVLAAVGRSQALAYPFAAAVFLFAVFVPALLIARWQLRKPPHPLEQPDP